ncbi:MAG: SPOR domain-containing protein [Hyphomicrobiales bacterium]
MSKSSGDTKTTAPLAESDPLAELAKLVSAGSVFGNVSDDATGEAMGDPSFEPSVAQGADSEMGLTAPATEALNVSNASTLDFDAELGAQLEAELVSELYESEAPVVAEPQVEAPVAPDVADIDEKISSALDEALNLEGFVSEAPVEAAVEAALPEAAVPEPVQEVAVDAPEIEPQINFESFEAEISAAAASGFPSVDVPTPSADFATDAPSAPAVDPMVAALEAPGFDASVIPSALPTGDVDPLDNIQFETAEDEFVADYENDNKSNGKGMLAIAAVLLVALVGGAGAYFIGAFGGGSDDPVVVAADNQPVRVKPDDPGGRKIPNQDSTVYNTLDGEEKDQTQESRLVVRSEEPEVGDSDRPRVISPNSRIRDVSATVPPSGPRTVKTVIVRPDGTLVRPEADDTAAASSPSETSLVDASETVANAAGQEVASAGEELTPRAVSTEALSSDAENASAEAPATSQETVQVAALPPIPRANNIRNRSTAAQAQPTQLTPTTRAPAATSSTPAANSGDYVVQLSAQRSDEAARTNFRRLQQRYSVLANYSLNVQRADLGDRGVYHRVRVGPFARSAANSVCERVKSQGGDCIVRRQ